MSLKDTVGVIKVKQSSIRPTRAHTYVPKNKSVMVAKCEVERVCFKGPASRQSTLSETDMYMDKMSAKQSFTAQETKS